MRQNFNFTKDTTICFKPKARWWYYLPIRMHLVIFKFQRKSFKAELWHFSHDLEWTHPSGSALWQEFCLLQVSGCRIWQHPSLPGTPKNQTQTQFKLASVQTSRWTVAQEDPKRVLKVLTLQYLHGEMSKLILSVKQKSHTTLTSLDSWAHFLTDNGFSLLPWWVSD